MSPTAQDVLHVFRKVSNDLIEKASKNVDGSTSKVFHHKTLEKYLAGCSFFYSLHENVPEFPTSPEILEMINYIVSC
jgi:hypothetical protein